MKDGVAYLVNEAGEIVTEVSTEAKSVSALGFMYLYKTSSKTIYFWIEE